MRAATQNCTVFLNSSSGLGSKDGLAERVAQQLAEGGMEACFEPCEKGGDIAAEAARAVAEGASLVVAGGGDGTLRAVASALVNTQATFGILPVGTLNHFARDLDIPLDVEAAAQVLLHGHPVRVDLAEVNGRVFINNSIIGLYPTYRFLREYVERRGWRNWLSIGWAVWTVFRRLPSLRLSFEVDGRTVVRTTPYVLVANNEHAMEGYQLGRRERMDRGELWIYVMRRRGRLGLLRMILDLVLGRFHRDRDFEVIRARQVRIEAKQRRLGVALDGEIVVLDTPLHYRSLPSALEVMVPRKA